MRSDCLMLALCMSAAIVAVAVFALGISVGWRMAKGMPPIAPLLGQKVKIAGGERNDEDLIRKAKL